MPSKFSQSPLIVVRYNKKRGKGGRGVYATRNIQKDSSIELAPCLLMPAVEIGANWDHVLPWYVFRWEKVNSVRMNAIGLGYISLYNHSYRPNAYYDMGKDNMAIWSLRDIKKGEEITINYNGDPKCQTKVAFQVNGSRRKKK